MASAGQDGVAKAIQKLQASIDAGTHYEGQQMVKTVYHRLRSRRQLEDSYHLLKEAAVLQLGCGQITCGAELAGLLLEAYTTDSVPANSAALQRIIELLSAFARAPAAAASAPVGTAGPSARQASPVDEATKFLTGAIRWAHRMRSPLAAAQLHQALAGFLWTMRSIQALAPVSLHYARSGDMDALAQVVADAAAQGQAREEDLFLARAALQVLALTPRTAQPPAHLRVEDLFDAYEEHTRHALPDTPLMHCISLLQKAVERRSPALAALAAREYARALARDPGLAPLLERVREVHLGQRPAGLGGLLGDMMKMLAAGEEEEEEQD